MTSAASTSKDSSEWDILHLQEFCPENDETCHHELMLNGLSKFFDHLDKSLKPDNAWRIREAYGVTKAKHNCVICLGEISPSDHPVGVFERTKKKPKRKTFVLHDTCLASISQNKDEVIYSIKSVPLTPKIRKFMERNCIFEGKVSCSGCKKSTYSESSSKRKIINCSDQFCNNSFHWECASKNMGCVIDFCEKIVYCKQAHERVQMRSNDCGFRGQPISHSPAQFEICVICSNEVPRWPMRGKVFYVSCCDIFLHYNCVLDRLKQKNMECGKCKDNNQYLESIERQGRCLLEYRGKSKNKVINSKGTSESQCNGSVMEEEKEEEAEKKKGVERENSDTDVPSSPGKENSCARPIKKIKYGSESEGEK